MVETDNDQSRDRCSTGSCEVPDPEIPVLSITDLGIVRDVES